LRLRQYYPGQEVINEKNNPVLAETPHYKEKQTILPNPIGHEEPGKKTPSKRTHDGKAKRKLIDLDGKERRSSESSQEDHSPASSSPTQQTKSTSTNNSSSCSSNNTPKKKPNKDDSKIDMRKMVLDHTYKLKAAASTVTVTEKDRKGSSKEKDKSSRDKDKDKDKDNDKEKEKEKERSKKEHKSEVTTPTASPAKMPRLANEVNTPIAANPPASTANAVATVATLPLPAMLPVLPLVPQTPFMHREAYVNSLNQKEPETNKFTEKQFATILCVCVAAIIN